MKTFQELKLIIEKILIKGLNNVKTTNIQYQLDTLFPQIRRELNQLDSNPIIIGLHSGVPDEFDPAARDIRTQVIIQFHKKTDPNDIKYVAQELNDYQNIHSAKARRHVLTVKYKG